ncbi:ABC transporter [Gracilaria domingensis]|nr:ABC transporter [Gracilaria domingensis]
MDVENQSSASPSSDVVSETPSSLKGRIKAIFAKKKEKEEHKTVPFKELFAYATRAELRYMFISIPAAAVHGCILPLFTIVFGDVINAFGGTDDTGEGAVALDEITSTVGGIAKWFLVLAAVAFVSSFLQVRFQLIFAHRVTNRLRRLYFQSLMRQDYSWYDSNDGGELTARVAGDVNLIQAGIGEKVATAVQFIVTFITGFIIAFIYGWKLTLIILAISPLLALGGVLFGKLAAESSSDTQKSYGAAGGVASEVLSLIRTVTAYNGQESEARRYDEKLQEAYSYGVRRSAYSGGALGFTYGVIFCTFAVAFTFGAGQVRSGAMEPGDIIITFFSVFIATISIGQASPAFNAFNIARGAAPRVYDVIRRKSEIDPLEDEGKVLDNVTGEIIFRDVQFNYPTRVVDDLESDARPNVLDNFNLKVSPGSSHALVGSSGCGKSTTVRLIERFYDVQEGQVLLDGIDVRELNVRFLRSQIGYVGQMPTLFMLSIRENIALGAAMEKVLDPETGEATLQRKEVTDDEIVAAAKKANAHDFIMKLPERYDTVLGERGAMLSGGQKQRVCIARALVRNPKILLLDESTSALDAQSERIVQEALEHAAEGRTTITIAHRLSTVKNADVISVIDQGKVVEEGNHTDLLSIERGAYRTLVEYQNVEGKKEKEEEEEEGDSSAVLKAAAEDPTKATSLSKTRVEEEEAELPIVDRGVLGRALKMNVPEIPYILVGMIGAAVAGASFPAMAITFTEVSCKPASLHQYMSLDVDINSCVIC